MTRAWLLPSIALIIFLSLYALTFNIDTDNKFVRSYCGSIFDVSYSYYDGGVSCRDPGYKLICEDQKPVLYLNYGRHRVLAISAANSSFQTIIAGVDNNNCSFITHQTMLYENITDTIDYLGTYNGVTFVSCENPVNSAGYVDTATSCGSGITTGHYSYVLPWNTSWSELSESCGIDLKVIMLPSGPVTCNVKCSYPEIRVEHVKGVELRWRPVRCGEWQQRDPCKFDNATNTVLCREKNESLAFITSKLI